MSLKGLQNNMNKPKLMFYINVLWYGGAERVILQLATQFQRAGYEVVMVTSFKDGNEYIIPEQISRITLEDKNIESSFFLKNLTRVIKLRKLCKTLKPDILISFMKEPNVRSIIATLGLRTKTIISVRNSPEKEYAGRVGKIIAKYILPLADGCVFQTQEARNWFLPKLQCKSTIIWNEVSEEFFSVNRTAVGKDIVSVGRLKKQKNHELLIDAYALLADLYPDVDLHIYGEGELKAILQDKIERLNLNNRIYLHGNVDNVSKVLVSAKCFVMTSDYEGMPNALMEAMAVGVPCIATDCPCGGPKELIKDGLNGLLIPVRNINALKTAMDRILSNVDYAKALGKEGKKTAVFFEPQKVFKEWEVYVQNVQNT